MEKCHCGLEKSFEDCCFSYLEGKETAPTAEALMRSRYSAFVTNNVDYIINTTHPDHRQDLKRDEVETWSKDSDWKSLEILGTDKGGVEDRDGHVEFVAKYEVKGNLQNHHEVSYFEKDDDRWYFIDGKIQAGTLVRSTPKIGRNDPCSCGSGKKFKKCCGG